MVPIYKCKRIDRMEEKFCTGCGKPFAGESDLCEECLEKQAEVTEEETVQTAEDSTVETEETVFETAEDTQSIPEESEFYVDYEEEEPQKTKNGAKITALVLGILGSGFGLYYLYEAIRSMIQQNQMMAQYGMASQLGIADYIPYIVLGLYFICGIVGSVLPKKAAKASLILLMIPSSWILISGIQYVFSLISAIGEGQQIAGKFVFVYCGLLSAGIFCLVAGILHATYLKYKND